MVPRGGSDGLAHHLVSHAGQKPGQHGGRHGLHHTAEAEAAQAVEHRTLHERRQRDDEEDGGQHARLTLLGAGVQDIAVGFILAAAAREQAADEGEEIEEFSYRYPGPKPRTKEAAVLLLCDGIESAARAMNDPTPSRIEALVRSLSRRRLDDGQLDDSALTFRELRVIEDSIIKSLCAIYHSRIAYPGGRDEREEREIANAVGGG